MVEDISFAFLIAFFKSNCFVQASCDLVVEFTHDITLQSVFQKLHQLLQIAPFGFSQIRLDILGKRSQQIDPFP